MHSTTSILALSALASTACAVNSYNPTDADCKNSQYQFHCFGSDIRPTAEQQKSDTAVEARIQTQQQAVSGLTGSIKDGNNNLPSGGWMNNFGNADAYVCAYGGAKTLTADDTQKYFDTMRYCCGWGSAYMVLEGAGIAVGVTAKGSSYCH